MRCLFRLPALVVAGALAACTGTDAPNDRPSGKSCDGCLVVRHARVVDADGVRADQRVAFRDGVIVEVADDDGSLAGAAATWDAAGGSLLPGLADMHVHLLFQGGGGNASYPPAMPRNLAASLYAGVTRVLDLGSPLASLSAARGRTRAAQWLAPALHFTGPFFTAPVGHPCYATYDLASCWPTSSEAEAEQWLARLVSAAPDLVKVVVEPGLPPQPPTPALAINTLLPAIVARAAGLDLRTVVHTTRADDALAAVDAGAAVLAHVPVDRALTAEEATRIQAANVAVITTLAFFDGVVRYWDDPTATAAPLVPGCADPQLIALLASPSGRAGTAQQLQPFVVPYRAFLATAQRNVKTLLDAGVRLVAGTDAGNFFVFHGAALHRELALLVGAGLTPRDALRSATVEAARLVGLDGDAGYLRVGQPANLLLVDGDPSVDITRTAAVRLAWRAGTFVTRESFASSAGVAGIAARTTPAGTGSGCTSSSECSAGHQCNLRGSYCERTCTSGAPGACPVGQGCVVREAGGPAVCVDGDGCSPLAQDCPHAGAYGGACFPVDPGAAFCRAPGRGAAGAACVVGFTDEGCAAGLGCAHNGICRALCAPASLTCSAGETCVDRAAEWGSGVGACQ